ncbi:MAG: hypothetical protein ACR650_09785 [Methylocystis sp.]
MNKFPLIFQLPPRMPDLGGGGGADATAAAGGAPSASGAPPPSPSPSAPGQPGEGSGAPTPQWRAPDGLPDRLAQAKSEKEFQELLLADYRAQREQISKIPAAGKSAEDYAYAPSDKVKAVTGDLSADPVLKQAQEAALKAGVAPSVFQNFVETFYGSMVESGALKPAPSAQAERLDYLGKTGLSEQEAVAQIKPHLERATAFVDGFSAQHNLPEGAKAELSLLLGSANGLRVLDALARAAAPGARPGGEATSGGPSNDEVLKMGRDPRAIRNSPQYDPAFAAKTHALMKERFG